LKEAAVVIPAHNEAGAIAKCLSALAGVRRRVVVCNGCSDDTAEQARASSRGEMIGTVVIETEVASKSNALNLGDSALADEGFPRFYVDADVVLTAEAVSRVSEAMERTPGVLVAAPVIEFDLANRPWAVRAFYEVWRVLPYCRSGRGGMIGSGVYAVSEEGRRRWGKFPDITADDAFVRLQFKPQERLTVEGCRFVVSVPRTLGGLVKIKTRAFFGDYELRARFPELFVNKTDGHARALMGLLREPRWWLKLGVYLSVRMVSRIMGYRRFHFGDHRKWERDETSREPKARGVGSV
jgi:glycosyltransferase involved in cell wall biosynthesis